jgi:4-carboxymuconolactone decarboxylase
MTTSDASSLSQTGKSSKRRPAPRVAPAAIHDTAPALGWYSDNVLFGEMWERTELSKRDRSIVTVAALITCGHLAQLTGHFNRALNHGVNPSEIVEMVTHLAFYAGWPCAVSSVGVMQQVFSARGIGPEQVEQSISEQLPVCQAETARYLGMVAPALEEFTERVVLGDLWQRTELAPRDRSLVTIASALAQGQLDQLPGQVAQGLENGLNEKEIAEALAHLAFYVGWHKARSALPVIEAAFRAHGRA